MSWLLVRRGTYLHSDPRVTFRNSLFSLSSQCLFIIWSPLWISPIRELLLQHSREASIPAILTEKVKGKGEQGLGESQWYRLLEQGGPCYNSSTASACGVHTLGWHKWDSRSWAQWWMHLSTIPPTITIITIIAQDGILHTVFHIFPQFWKGCSSCQ